MPRRGCGRTACAPRTGALALCGCSMRARFPSPSRRFTRKCAGKGCDFATVFRFVSILEEKELVQRVAWIDGTTRHEICATDGHHHHHYLICRTCHKVEPIDECVVERFEDQIAKERGYAGLSHSLQLSGVCPQCQKPKTAKDRQQTQAFLDAQTESCFTARFLDSDAHATGDIVDFGRDDFYRGDDGP